MARAFLRIASLLFLVGLMGSSDGAFAQKTDTLILHNGNIITGEVKRLSRGKLEYSTDDMGTVYVEWDKIIHLISTDAFEVELSSTAEYFGTLDATEEPGKLRVLNPAYSIALDMDSVIRITPIEARYWSRFSGSIDVGFDFTRANRQTVWNLGSKIRYRSRKQLFTADFSSYLNVQQDTIVTTRNTIGLNDQFFLQGPWSVLIGAQLHQNEELNLDRRFTGGGGITYFFVQTNYLLLDGQVGLLLNNERYSTSEEDINSIEGLLRLELAAFRFNDPEVDFTLTSSLYPSLTERGRTRAALQSTLRYELIEDLFIGLNGFLDFDSNPPAEGASKIDYGITSSLGWSF